MRCVIEVECIICERNFPKYAEYREKTIGRIINKRKLGKVYPRPRFTYTCSSQCSKKYVKVYHHIMDKKFKQKLDDKTIREVYENETESEENN